MAKQPVHEIRFGLIKGVVWKNSTSVGERSSIAITRLYKNGDRWVESQQFGRDDLPLVAKVADLLHSWIFEQGSK